MSKLNDESLFFCRNTNIIKYYFPDWVYVIETLPCIHVENQQLKYFGSQIAKLRPINDIKCRPDFAKMNFIFVSTVMFIESLNNASSEEQQNIQALFMNVNIYYIFQILCAFY